MELSQLANNPNWYILKRFICAQLALFFYLYYLLSLSLSLSSI